jgi:putative membrane protein
LTRAALSLALAALTLHCMPEQQVHPKPRSATTKGPVLTAQDRDFLERATQGNNGEIAVGGLVHGRALRPEVVQFGQMMVNDHRAANAQLGAVARQLGIHALPSSLGEHQAAYDRLIDRRGDPFDREFMKVMIDDHTQAVLLYRGELSGGVDPRLKQYAAAMLPKIQAHLAHARSLAALAEPRQEGTDPPTPDATTKPPGSTVPREP